MGKVRSAVRTGKNILGKINPHYDMCLEQVDEIYNNSSHKIDAIFSAFCFGYAQGLKAAKAARRKEIAL